MGFAPILKIGKILYFPHLWHIYWKTDLQTQHNYEKQIRTPFLITTFCCGS